MPSGSERIRVLQVITRLAARGAPRHVIDLSERLDPERFEVDILTGTPDADEGSLLEEGRGRGLRVSVVEETGGTAMYSIVRSVEVPRYGGVVANRRQESEARRLAGD